MEDHSTCKICYCEFEDKDKISKMFNCGHKFHVDCIKQFYKIGISESNVPFHCPIDTCRKEVNPKNVEMVLDKQDIIKYEERSLAKYIDKNPDVSWCPTPGCKNSCYHGDGTTQFYCEMCDKEYCIICRTPWHEGMTCAENKVNSTA